MENIVKMRHTLESRLERARRWHSEGYNCSQCVAMAFDDLHNLDNAIVARLSSGFGGGVGGQRQVCGAVSGMTLIIGLTGYDTPSGKQELYRTVRHYSDEFLRRNGSIVCGDLLAPGRKPCMSLIEDAITILHNRMENTVK